MAQQRVLITTSYLGPGDEVDRMLLDAQCTVAYARPQDRASGRVDLVDALGDTDAVIWGTEPLTAELMAAAPGLQIVARTGVGYDNIDLDAARERGIAVCITPGANRQSVTEFAIALILDCARGISTSVADTRAGGWEQRSGAELSGSVLGIVGLGDIGKQVAIVGQAMGMEVVAHDPALDERFAAAHGILGLELSRLLATADFVTLHLALTADTHHLIDRSALASMKPGSYLINTSRGGVVDEDALAEALHEGWIRGAALDVLETEPLPVDHVLRQAPGLLVTPHIGGATEQARSRSGLMAAGQVIDRLNGRSPAHTVAGTGHSGEADATHAHETRSADV